LQLRGSIQIDMAFQPTQDLLFLTRSSGSGRYTTNFIPANQQDHWGYEVNVKPKFDARNETSWGTFRAYVELKGAIDAGAFNGPGGFGGNAATQINGGGTAFNAKEVNTFTIYRAYIQYVGFTLGEADSAFSTGGFKDGDIQNVLTGEKQSSYLFSYTWTPSGPGQPPKKGGAPVPDGWSATISAEVGTKYIAKNNFGNAVNQGLVLTPGAVAVAQGGLEWPDLVGRIHYEADPAGKDEQFNDQWSIGTFHLVGGMHNINQIATGGGGLTNVVAGTGVGCPGGSTCDVGIQERTTGYAAAVDLKIFTPMWGPAKKGSIASADVDSLWFEVCGSVAASVYCGVGQTNGSLYAGDAYWMGGLVFDDGDYHVINNGNGGFSFDKTSLFSFNVQYHHIITDCTDPINCWRFNIEYNYARLLPGSASQLTDWTLGGAGAATKNSVTANLIWGANRPPVSVPTSAEVSFEVQYNKITRDLPGNCNGGLSACVAATDPAIFGVTKDPSNWVGRLTITKGW
jgi:hypothetical protein